MTRQPEDSPGGGGQRRPGTRPAPEYRSSGTGRDGATTPSAAACQGVPGSPVTGDASQTPAPVTPITGAGPQSPAARTGAGRFLSHGRTAGDADPAEEARQDADASPAGLRGEEALKAWKRAEAAKNARQRNQRGRRPRSTPRPKPGMHRRMPPGSGGAA